MWQECYPRKNLHFFYHHLSLEMMLPALKLLQNCCIMNIDSPTHHIYSTWKTISISAKTWKQGKFKKFNFPTVWWIGKNFKIKSKLIFKNSNFQQVKLRSPARATLKNPNFQFLCELEKTCKYSQRTRFKSPNFESIDELGKIMF